MTQGNKLALLCLVLAYAIGVSVYAGSTFPMGGTPVAGSASLIKFFAGYTFATLLASSLGFTVLVAALDVLTKRRPQPLSALIFALAVFVTIEGLMQLAFVHYWQIR
jgi:hypothetical protein